MSYENDKLIAFENAILSDTTREIAAIEEQLKSFEAAELEKAQDEEYNYFFLYMQDQVQGIKAKYKKEITKAELTAKQDLLRYRNALSEALFEKAKKRILDFTQTTSYPSYLQENIKRALEKFPCNSAVLSLRKQDMAYAELLKQAFQSLTAVVEDRQNTLGGFCLINEEKGLLEDSTFASALESKKPTFYAACGLSVQF